MTEADRSFLALGADLLEYPDDDFFEIANRIRSALEREERDARTGKVIEFIDQLRGMEPRRAREDYVAIFDHDPAASMHMAWHRYGNDRGQGKAMAALNGLYRAAGFEPTVSGAMPDYLPRMLEFMAIAEDWAIEALLDGFGAELHGLVGRLKELNSPYATLLETLIGPLRTEYPELLKPRTRPDPTRRPMANPEPEEAPVELVARTEGVKKRNGRG
ncbi:MAG: nitrate reductase molybdenum cofactor assembly chaperone [Desulfovibrio sp.]|nr:nitrate reductase molybdenum cofactor assembly chaperone [Desulfovibrio sp.]